MASTSRRLNVVDLATHSQKLRKPMRCLPVAVGLATCTILLKFAPKFILRSTRTNCKGLFAMMSKIIPPLFHTPEVGGFRLRKHLFTSITQKYPIYSENGNKSSKK